MKYKYYNQFNLSKELSQVLSSIISEKENEDYVCSVLTVTIPEHKGLVFHSPLTDDCICRPGASALSGAQIRKINEEYGGYINGVVPAEEYSFFVVMKRDKLDEFLKLSFEDRKAMEKELQSYSVICEYYFGVFNSKVLVNEFPYLEELFSYLDEWRAENSRVTVDDDVLEKGRIRTIKN